MRPRHQGVSTLAGTGRAGHINKFEAIGGIVSRVVSSVAGPGLAEVAVEFLPV